MEKLKVRHIVGWRERETLVRRNRVRMRASAGAFRVPSLLATATAEPKKKT